MVESPDNNEDTKNFFGKWNTSCASCFTFLFPIAARDALTRYDAMMDIGIAAYTKGKRSRSTKKYVVASLAIGSTSATIASDPNMSLPARNPRLTKAIMPKTQTGANRRNGSMDSTEK